MNVFLLSLFFLRALVESWILYMKSSRSFEVPDNLFSSGENLFQLLADRPLGVPSPTLSGLMKGHPCLSQLHSRSCPRAGHAAAVLRPSCFSPCQEWSVQVPRYSEDRGQAGVHNRKPGGLPGPLLLGCSEHIFFFSFAP